MPKPSDSQPITTQTVRVGEQEQPLLGMQGGLISISYLAGTIDSVDQMRFKKIVFRATRGKALTYLADLEASVY